MQLEKHKWRVEREEALYIFYELPLEPIFFPLRFQTEMPMEAVNVFIEEGMTHDAATVAASTIDEHVQAFLSRSECRGTKLAVVTSGGTTVPLEANAVRFVSNFSGGGRGSALAESFLAQGWCVIFLHAKKSLMPFRRHLDALPLDSLAHLLLASPSSEPNTAAEDTARQTFEKYVRCRERLLTIEFDTVTSYIHTLRSVCNSIGVALSSSMDVDRLEQQQVLLLVLAAAVSDYYCPRKQLAEHKISGGDGLNIHLANVPKALGCIRPWLGQVAGSTAKIASFKLETDAKVLEKKATGNLKEYGCDAVVANLLQSYREEVRIYIAGGGAPMVLRRNDIDAEDGVMDLDAAIAMKLEALLFSEKQ